MVGSLDYIGSSRVATQWHCLEEESRKIRRREKRRYGKMMAVIQEAGIGKSK